MYFNLMVLTLVIALPYVAWRKKGQPSDLFLCAALAWSCYSAWICLQNGLSQSFEISPSASVQYEYWRPNQRVAALLFGGYILLKLLSKIDIYTHVRYTFLAFWGIVISLFLLAATSEIFHGYQYPPIWYERLNSEQLNSLNIFSELSVFVGNESAILFLLLVVSQLIWRAPVAARRALQYIRSL